MKKLSLILLILSLFTNVQSQTQSNIKALVGGTLIDGYGSKPIRKATELKRALLTLNRQHSSACTFKYPIMPE